jgi:hypothetical protein
MDFIVNAINGIDMGKTYQNGDHIVCAKEGGECAFLQGTASGVPGSKIKDLIAELKGHNCKDCGSVPIVFPDSNDPSSGILTVNFVSDIGACTADDGICDASRPAPPAPDPPAPTDDGKFEWAVIGDSWSSGVAYSKNNAYDLNGCFRTTEAWGAQMEGDATWTVNPQNFHFAACGGATMDKLKSSQIGNTGSPSLIVSTVGGNNAFFGTTVDNCVYQGKLGSYGNPWDQDPDGTGSCKQSLQKTQDYIDNAAEGLPHDLTLTLDDLFASDQAHSRPEFYMYLSSYAKFFNADAEPCNDWSFAPAWRFWKPKLVQGLRKEFNDKLDAFHAVYSNIASTYAPPTNMHLGFIPISDGFEGHRFCEPQHTLADQWSSPDVWIWNLQYRDSQTDTDQLGNFLTDANNTQYQDLAPGDNENNYAAFTLFATPDEVAAQGSSQPGSGWSSRPFHPKFPGYTAMKDTMIQRLKTDLVPGVKVD